MNVFVRFFKFSSFRDATFFPTFYAVQLQLNIRDRFYRFKVGIIFQREEIVGNVPLSRHRKPGFCKSSKFCPRASHEFRLAPDSFLVSIFPSELSRRGIPRRRSRKSGR